MTKNILKSLFLEILLFNSIVEAVEEKSQLINSLEIVKLILGIVFLTSIVVLYGILVTNESLNSYSSESLISKNILQEHRLIQQSNVYKLKLRIYCGLHKPCGCSKYYHLFVLILFFMSCIVFNITIFEEEINSINSRNNPTNDTNFWTFIKLNAEDFTNMKCILDSILTVILTFEITFRIWSSSCIQEYQGFNGMINYMKSHIFMRSLDLFAIFTFLAFIYVRIWTHNESLSVFIRLLHLFQIFQLYRLMFRILKLMVITVYDQKNQLYIASIFAVLVLIFTSFCIYLVEKDFNQNVNNIYDAFWLIFVTFTTIGYGDIKPLTTFGRALTCFCAVLGICLFALPANIFGTGLALKIQEEQQRSVLYRNPAAKLIQSIWRCYASNRKSKSIANWNLYTKEDGQPLNINDKESIRFIQTVKYMIARHHFKATLRIYEDISEQTELSRRVEFIEKNVNILSYKFKNTLDLQLYKIDMNLKKITSKLKSNSIKNFL